MLVSSLAHQIGGETIGDAKFEVTGIASFDDAQQDNLVVVLSAKYLKAALASKARVVVLGADIACPADGRTYILVSNPRLAMAKALHCFPDKFQTTPGIHQTAFLEDSVSVGPRVSIGAHCVIGKDVIIGHSTILHPGVTVYPGVSIGDHVVVHSGAVLGGDGFGYVRDAGQIIKVPQRGGLIIESNVEIGANTTIDRGTISPTLVGRGTKIDNLVQIAHNCKVGKNCLIAAATAIGGSSTIGDNVTIAGFVAISDHVNIGDNVTVGGRSGVIKDVPSNTIVSGFPAQEHREELRFWARLRSLARSR